MASIKSKIHKAIEDAKQSAGKKPRELDKDELYFFQEAYKSQISLSAATRAYNKVFGRKATRYWVNSVYQRLGYKD